MKYSYEFKLKSVEMYHAGRYPKTPNGISTERFHKTIREWACIEEAAGTEALRHKSRNKEWTAEERYELVAKVLAGASCRETAIKAGINRGLLYQWIKRYNIQGYEGLAAMKKGRQPKEAPMKKKVQPSELTPSEREEMRLYATIMDSKLRRPPTGNCLLSGLTGSLCRHARSA